MEHNTPVTKRRKITEFSFYVTKLGLTQKEAASILGISEKLAGKWVRQYRLKNRMNNIQASIIAKPVKFDDSLSAFRAYLRISHPALFASLETSYQQFLKKI